MENENIGLTEELSKRPHVPSGEEAKLLRKLKAQLKISEKEIRENPEYRKMLSDAEKSETKTKKNKKRQLIPFIKKFCKDTNLPPYHPKIKEMVLKYLEDHPYIYI